MLRTYIEKKLKNARYKILADGTFFGEIPGVRGVWSNSKTLEECREELEEVLEDWLFLKIYNREQVPGFALKLRHRVTAKYA